MVILVDTYPHDRVNDNDGCWRIPTHFSCRIITLIRRFGSPTLQLLLKRKPIVHATLEEHGGLVECIITNDVDVPLRTTTYSFPCDDHCSMLEDRSS